MLKVGEGTTGTEFIDITFDDGTENVIIGKYCTFAQHVRILYEAEHNIRTITTYPFGRPPQTKGHVIIGNDVWVGWDVTILSGVQIGDGAVIGAGSVVASYIPSYTIAVGNPCKPIKERFGIKDYLLLKDMKWWDWPSHLIQQARPLLCGVDVGALVTFYNTYVKEVL